MLCCLSLTTEGSSQALSSPLRARAEKSEKERRRSSSVVPVISKLASISLHGSRDSNSMGDLSDNDEHQVAEPSHAVAPILPARTRRLSSVVQQQPSNAVVVRVKDEHALPQEESQHLLLAGQDRFP